MFYKKVLSGIISTVLLASTISVSAATFSDVENDATVAWAKPYISEMSEKGYIKGYEDGTFKPNNTISKTEALILLSRMIGVNEESFADSVEFAVDEYSSVLRKYSTNYAKEVSFLLYAGVLDADELDNYLSSANKNAALKRYEAAVLLTKLLGAEEEVTTNAFVSSSYSDTVEIPSSARAYVEYVKEKGIMQGMGNDANGAPIFSPNTYVTRSQMAKMLCCLIDVIGLSTQTGTVVSTDAFNETVTVTIDGSDIINKITSGTKYKVNGKDVSLSEIKRGMFVKITHVAGKVILVENQVVIEDTVLYGLIAKTSDSNSSQTITVADANNTKKQETYVLAEGAKVRINGAIDLFSRLKVNDYVAITVENGFVTLVEVKDKNSTASGVIKSIDVLTDYIVLNIEDSKGNVTSFETSAGGVEVSRNNLDSSVSQLMIGDSVSMKLSFGKVIKIQASSKNNSDAGVINYIKHSVNGTTIGIETNGEVVDFKVNKSVKVIIDSSENATVYDLRPGTDISVGLQSSEIVKIQAAGVVAKSQLTGIVKSVNATYGLLIIEENGTEYNVFVNSNTKIIDSVTGRNILLKNVDKNRTASVTGSNSSGVLEASVIVLQ